MPLWHTPLETFGGHLGYRSKYYRAYINLVNWRDKNETPEPEQTHDVSLTSIPEPPEGATQDRRVLWWRLKEES